MPRTIIGGREIFLRNDDGTLSDPKDWSEELTKTMAGEEGLMLDPIRWELINFARQHFEVYGDLIKRSRFLPAYNEIMRERLSEDDLLALFPETDVLPFSETKIPSWGVGGGKIKGIDRVYRLAGLPRPKCDCGVCTRPVHAHAGERD